MMPHTLAAAGILLAACAQVAWSQAPAVPERKPLFNGVDLQGWTRRDGTPMVEGWVVEDGCIHRAGKGGDLFTNRDYADFILELEWKIAPKGNSGIKYRFGATGVGPNGLEYQILDDAQHPDGKLGAGKRRTACLYDILAGDTGDAYRQPGEWNTTRIVARGSQLEHWLNGVCILRCDTDTEAFREAVRQSKFAKDPAYGSRRSGRIMLQDHGDPVWFRNLAITELAPAH